MDMVSDASAFLAVVLNEASREWVIEKTAGYKIIAPEVLPYELANALIAVKRKGRLTDGEVLTAFDVSQLIPVSLVSMRIRDALQIAVKHSIHAYDAFYLQCCIETNLPLISLDNRMCAVATSLSIKVVSQS
jgi:predicted nucleic acid-binding protein